MHTNHTTNYELSQFIATDKPTFLGDYNGDMLKIDTAIAGVNNKATAADSKADLATTAANSAAEAASGAVTTANAASTTATSALTTANAASTAASAAQSTADSASTTATAASTKANTLESIVNTELTANVLTGATSVTFTDAKITATAKLLLFFDDEFIPFTGVTAGVGTVTYTFEALAADAVATLWIVDKGGV